MASKKFDDFMAALERLCVEHGVGIYETMEGEFVVYSVDEDEKDLIGFGEIVDGTQKDEQGNQIIVRRN